MKAAPKRRLGGNAPLYQLKITLKWTKPPIWRRVVVRANMKLDRLHSVIQAAMGWYDCHLHQFIAGSRAGSAYFGMPDPDFDELGETLDERRYTVADLAPMAKDKFIYEYDFGDSWEHQVVVEKVLPPDPGFTHPVCLAGANAAPPEDCGGIPGFYRLLEIMADPTDPEHEEMKEWVGGEFNPVRFDAGHVNAKLQYLKA